ncbi:MAG: histone deacetylase [Deltaproteobacteria bacterium]|nr:histone deacetylase [Deltaproteobacteria bacterium]
MARSCGIVFDKRYLLHDTGAHVEVADRLRSIGDMLDETGILGRTTLIEPRCATEEEILLNHSSSYLERLKKMGPGYLDADTVVSEKSYETALLAAGGCLNMVDAIMKKEIDNGFAFVRPPGHHAERERGMGFCLFNNVAIAARYLINEYKLQRIVILDWDVHHGNGTQHSFYGEREALYLSIHQSPCYPGTGSVFETGEGDGEGYTINLPIPAGAGDRAYLKSFEELFIPGIKAYAPEIILVSAGFDSHCCDPLGGMEVSAAGFAEMARMLVHTAENQCDGKIGFFLEGGYSLDGLAESVKEVLLVALGEEEIKKKLTDGINIDPVIEKAKSIHHLA